MFETLSSLFIFGGWFFWLALIALSLFAMIVSENDNGRGWLTSCTVAFFVLFGSSAYHWTVNLITFKGLLFCLVGYIAVGMIWTLVKWWLHVSKTKVQVQEYKAENDCNGYAYDNLERALTPSKNKSRITVWGVYWPFSMVWSTIHESAEAAFLALMSWYKTMAQGAMTDLQSKKPRA